MASSKRLYLPSLGHWSFFSSEKMDKKGVNMFKKRKILSLRHLFHLLLAILVGTAAAVVLTASPVLAASANVSPSRDIVGSLVHVTGSGFDPGDTYEIRFADDTPYEVTRNGTVAVDGSISRFLTVPEMPTDTYTVVVEDSTSSESDSFTVEPALELDRSSATVGTLIVVDGTGFRADRNVSIRFDGSTVERTSTNSRGSFHESFRVPEADHGTHRVSADDVTNDLDESLLVLQSISIDPSSGTTGAEVEVVGTGFRDNRTITITFDGEIVATSFTSVRSDDNGSFTASFDVPPCFNRTVEVEASDGQYHDSQDFVVLATISLSADSGQVGDVVSIDGTGFGGNRTVTITFGGSELATRPMTVRTNSTGCFTVEFNVPERPGVSHTIIADDSSDTAQADFTILPDITLSPSLGRIGVRAEVEGTGFRGNQTVTVRFNGEHVSTTATDANGSFSDSFMVPAHSSGNYPVMATDGVNSLTTTFTITVSVSLEPNKGYVGMPATLSGTGFTGPVTVRYEDEVVSTVTADTDGNFAVTFDIPASVHGVHTVSASDALNTVETVFTMESDPPPAPFLLIPENGSRQGSRPTLDWQAVTDPSGVTYTLQIATDPSFSNIVLQKDGLSEPAYSLVAAEKLEAAGRDAPYYWRVRAVDLASNTSDWSVTGTFYVWVFPLWAILVISISGAVAIAVAVSRRVWHR